MRVGRSATISAPWAAGAKGPGQDGAQSNILAQILLSRLLCTLGPGPGSLHLFTYGEITVPIS